MRTTAYALAVVAALPVTGAASDATLALGERDRNGLAQFERKTALAKQLGATHVPITENLPPALWYFDSPGDPYPAWYIQRPDFLKLFPPPEVEPFVDREYGRRVVAILETRCAVLRRLGLKAHWASNLPQVLPEAFFAEYPHLRGPRVDQPNRSRVARFSPCVDQPETRRLYATAMRSLLERCPEIDSFSFLTQDSGSGFCWVPALYPGLNGHGDCRERPVSERIADFLVALKDAATQAGREIEITLNPITPRQWMLPSFSPEELDAIVHRLPRGVAVQGREGPDGRRFAALGGSRAYSQGAFHPVVGIVVPDLRWLRGFRPPAAAGTQRILISLRADEESLAAAARFAGAGRNTAGGRHADRMAALRAVAAAEAGEANADNLVDVWLLLDDAARRLDALDFGDMLMFGHVLNRWVNRPMVPFPDELTAEEKAHYRPFLFQAKGETQAENLIDIQAMRMFEGWGARMLFQRVIETVVPDVAAARNRVALIRDSAGDSTSRERWDLLHRRLEVAICLLHSADHMVGYQAQLERVKSLGVAPEPSPVLGVQGSWDRTDLLDLARREIDNTVRVMRLLEHEPARILDLAPASDEETIMRLGPDIVAQLKRKIDIMNAHWRDYDRLFTVPNP